MSSLLSSEPQIRNDVPDLPPGSDAPEAAAATAEAAAAEPVAEAEAAEAAEPEVVVEDEEALGVDGGGLFGVDFGSKR